MNWKGLKDFCNLLPENVLGDKVVLWRENECISDISAEILQEDMYIDEDDEGYYSLDDAGITIEEAKERGLGIAYAKGSPILWDNF